METRCRNIIDQKIRLDLNFDCCLSVPSIGLSGGLMLLWNNEWDVQIMSYSQGHIDASVIVNGLKWRFSGIYGQPTQEKRHETWDLIQRLHSIPDLHGFWVETLMRSYQILRRVGEF